MGQGKVGLLGEGMPNVRAPDVRRKYVHQGAASRDREEQCYGNGLLGKASRNKKEASGEMAWSKVLVT
jgi:hypothetical protein